MVGADPDFIVRSTAEGKLIRVIVRYKDLQGFDEEATSESVGMPLVDKGDVIFTISGTAVNDPNQGTRTFLALNDGTAGFNANSDSIAEITGFSGALTSFSII